jgi:hypothetical protein
MPHVTCERYIGTLRAAVVLRTARDLHQRLRRGRGPGVGRRRSGGFRDPNEFFLVWGWVGGWVGGGGGSDKFFSWGDPAAPTSDSRKSSTATLNIILEILN